METREKFSVGKVLQLPCTYCGEFVGWDDVEILSEMYGLLHVRHPSGGARIIRFRRDELERDGRAMSVPWDLGRPQTVYEAFVPGRWKAELDQNGCPARYVLRDS